MYNCNSVFIILVIISRFLPSDGQLQYKKIADFVDEDSSDAFSPEAAFTQQQQQQSVNSVLFQLNNAVTSSMTCVTSPMPPSSSPCVDRTTPILTQVSNRTKFIIRVIKV